MKHLTVKTNTDGSVDEVEVKKAINVIDYVDELPEATKDSPDFVQPSNGKLYRKRILDGLNDKYFALYDDSEYVIMDQKDPAVLHINATYIRCSLTRNISGGGYFCFINCTGTLTISSDSVQIYIIDSPSLTVSGITLSNWMNIFIDGVASYGQATRFLNGIQILKNIIYNNPNAPSEKTVSFQVSFISSDYTIALAPSISDTDYQFYKAMPAIEKISGSQFKLKLVSFDGNEQVSPAVDYIAIGKWK